MRILFINTEDSNGGAAVVTRRLMTGLHNKYGTENNLLVKLKRSPDSNTKVILSSKYEILAEKIIDRLSRKSGALYQYFPFSSPKILTAATSFKPDIINLHNIQGGYFAIPLLRKLSKIAPVVWTLHDMWSFTGNASHTFGNTSWKTLKNDAWLAKIPPSIGINTGAFLLRQKKSIYQKSNLTIVTPSLWLKNLADQSPVFEGKKIYQIYNGINPDIFHTSDKQLAKTKLGFPDKAKTIMFSSNFLEKNNPWKGGTDLLHILSKINAYTKEKINLIMLGEGQLEGADRFSNFQLFYGGYVKEENIMRDYLAAADLFIYPTRADNLPNVLVESIACGTPCITFDIGGNKEIIEHKHNGIVIEPFNFDAFAHETIDLIGDDIKRAEFSNNCIKRTQKLFLSEKMIDAYFRLLQETAT